MTATLLAMLNAARALHERDEDDPRYCTTCGDVNTATGDWPCPTATALGATGRSEWTNTPAAEQAPLQCPSWGPDGNNHPTKEDENYRCERLESHTGKHKSGWVKW